MSYRLSSKNPIDVRSIDSETQQPKIKVFFVVEGAETEHIYLNSFITKFEDNAVGDFIILDRLDRSKSHQEAVTKQIASFINSCNELNTQQIALLQQAKNSLESPELNETSLNIILKSLKDSDLPKEVLDLIFLEIPNTTFLHLYILESIINFQNYVPDFDKVCILIDRDKQSFKEGQYDNVLTICSENNFLLGISNPCFELFLFLHFSDLLEHDHSKIIENKKIARSKNSPKYMEKVLKDFVQTNLQISYNKSTYNAEKFVSSFQNIPENITKSQVTTNINQLKDSIGTSVYDVLAPLVLSLDNHNN